MYMYMSWLESYVFMSLFMRQSSPKPPLTSATSSSGKTELSSAPYTPIEMEARLSNGLEWASLSFGSSACSPFGVLVSWTLGPAVTNQWLDLPKSSLTTLLSSS